MTYNNIQKVIRSLKPLIKNILIKRSVFLFLTLNEHCDSFYESFYQVMLNLNIDVIYDWGFGILTNRARIYFDYYVNRKYCFEVFPDVVFLSGIFGRKKVVMTELKTKCILTVGIIDQKKLILLDYSLPGKVSIEYLYYFFKLLLFLLNQEYLRHSRFKRIKIKKDELK